MIITSNVTQNTRKNPLNSSILCKFRLSLRFISYPIKERLMLENTLPELQQLIEDIIADNSQLKTHITSLENQNNSLREENEVLQLEALEGEESQKKTQDVLAGLLGKLQSAKDVA